MRLHGVRQNRIDHQRRHRFVDQLNPVRRGRVRDPDPRSGGVGRAHGRRIQLLREGKPRHLQRQGPVPDRAGLRHEPHLRRVRVGSRVVRQLRRGQHHRGPPGLRAEEVHRGAVARHRYGAV